MGLEQTATLVSAVLLLDEPTSAKVKAVYDAEGPKYSEAMRGIFESAGGDREAAMKKMEEERGKAAERIKTALKGILSEKDLKDVEPILVGTGFGRGGRDPYLYVLSSLSLTPDQRTKMRALTVPYAQDLQTLGRRTPGEAEGDRTQRAEKLKTRTADFKKAAGGILTADQNKKWEEEATKLQAQWEKEREEMRARMGGGAQR
jgi:hypothetical protein